MDESVWWGQIHHTNWWGQIHHNNWWGQIHHNWGQGHCVLLTSTKLSPMNDTTTFWSHSFPRLVDKFLKHCSLFRPSATRLFSPEVPEVLLLFD